jgi:hypothetical protein
MTLHATRTHPEPAPDCFGCKAATLSLATGDAKAAKN